MIKYLKNVVTLQLDVDTCNGCGMCILVCPHGVFDMANSKAAVVDLNACIECGACAINCPVNAIKVQTGAGCASGILLGAIGKGCECSSECGVSPATTKTTDNDTSCCGNDNPDKNGKSSCCG